MCVCLPPPPQPPPHFLLSLCFPAYPHPLCLCLSLYLGSSSTIQINVTTFDNVHSKLNFSLEPKLIPWMWFSRMCIVFIVYFLPLFWCLLRIKVGWGGGVVWNYFANSMHSAVVLRRFTHNTCRLSPSRVCCFFLPCLFCGGWGWVGCWFVPFVFVSWYCCFVLFVDCLV